MQTLINYLRNQQAQSNILRTGTFNRKAKIIVSCFAILLLSYFLPGCTKEQNSGSTPELQTVTSKPLKENEYAVGNYERLGQQAVWELQQVRAATARYRNLKNALKDGYVDINAVVPGMGHHYMKMLLVDARFELRKPELLVYDKLADGSFELVAVEYAVPTALSPTAPEGFTGSSDVWERNDAVEMWFLHAWVWLSNPDGVFNPTNPLVHTQ